MWERCHCANRRGHYPQLMQRRSVALIGYDDAQSLDLVGPLEVFASASKLAELARRRVGYRVSLLSPGGAPIRCSSGLQLVADGAISADAGPFHTLLIGGGAGSRKIHKETPWLEELGGLTRRARRVGSVCTGAFVLAKLGLLDGRRATTHWQWCEKLAELHPEIQVEADQIYVQDGRYWTSAGVTAGMDLALALVEADLGREVALDTARQLVMYVQRSGGQSQFSPQLAAQYSERPRLRELQQRIQAEPAADHSVPALARRAGMSPRHFARVFQRELGVTPAAYVESVRIDLARRLLGDSVHSVDEVASIAGFGCSESLRRAFSRRLGTTPREYRARFQLRRSA